MRIASKRVAELAIIASISAPMDKEPPSGSFDAMPDALFVRRVLIFVGIVAFAAALYVLSDILLLIFGSVLVAVVLRAIARPIRAGTSISERLALLAAGLGVVALLGGTGYLFGSRISSQLASVFANLPAAMASLSKTVPFASSVSELVKGSSIGELVMNAFSWGTTIFGAVATLVVVLVAGIYVAIDPDTYRNGLVKLFPKRAQAQIAATLDDAGEALRLWLGGQLLAMIMVGLLIAGGLALVGVPSALALGLIAGVTEFVPIIGPVIGAVPALLLASTQNWNLVMWTLAVFVVVQQIECKPHHAAGGGTLGGGAARGRALCGGGDRGAVRAARPAARLPARHRHRRGRASPLCARDAGRGRQNCG